MASFLCNRLPQQLPFRVHLDHAEHAPRLASKIKSRAARRRVVHAPALKWPYGSSVHLQPITPRHCRKSFHHLFTSDKCYGTTERVRLAISFFDEIRLKPAAAAFLFIWFDRSGCTQWIVHTHAHTPQQQQQQQHRHLPVALMWHGWDTDPDL